VHKKKKKKANEPKMGLDVKEIVVEFLVTAAFVTAALASGGHPVVCGAALALFVYIGQLMGDHANFVNPAITLGLLVTGQIEGVRAASLLAVQVLGGVSAAAAVLLLLHSKR